MKRWIIYIVIFCALILLGLFLFNRNEEKRYKVLIIQSYEPACKSAQSLTNEIGKDLDDSDIKTDRRTFYLGSVRKYGGKTIFSLYKYLPLLP